MEIKRVETTFIFFRRMTMDDQVLGCCDLVSEMDERWIKLRTKEEQVNV